MKYLVLLADGMADEPLAELSGATPLQVAQTPRMDWLAQHGNVGLVRMIPPEMPPGSDVANLAVLGYDPRLYYTGRSPLEALSIGVDLGPDDVAFRCNLVTLEGTAADQEPMMFDYSAGEITTAEARQLMADLAAQLDSEQFHFYPGTSYRQLLVWPGGPVDSRLTPPHDISGQTIGPYLPHGSGAAELTGLIQRSQVILGQHPVNLDRISRGLRPANSIWIWGQGKRPALKDFFELHQLHGAVIAAVDLAKGLGIAAGLQVIEVAGATGNCDTNFRGKAAAAREAFQAGLDLVYLHIEAPDEAGHQGDLANKIKAIERIDHEVLGSILTELPQLEEEFKIWLLPDHPTPLAKRTHTSDPVPFVIYDSTNAIATFTAPNFSEASARETGLLLNHGHQLMERFIQGGDLKAG